MSIAPFDHPFLSGLLGDAEISRAFSVESDLEAMIRFEAGLADAEAEIGVIPSAAAAAIVAACSSFSPDIEALRAGTRKDGGVVPDLVRQLRAAVGEEHGRYVHVGATSQDLIDTSLVLRLQPVLDLFGDRLRGIAEALDRLDRTFGDRPLMGKTRMRSAIPMRVGDRLRSWSEPIGSHLAELEKIRPRLSMLQFGGAVGTLDALGDEAAQVRAALAARLKLRDPLGPWHVQRLPLGQFGSFLSEIGVTLGKIGTDVCLMVQDEIATLQSDGGGHSSAMPHKRNPIDAETLVALARYNAAQLGGLHQSLIHEQERSGAMWTLEWLILPPMVAATGAALATAQRMLGAVSALGGPVEDRTGR